MQGNRQAQGLTLMQQVGMVAFCMFVVAVLWPYRAEARRTNIQGGDSAVAVFTDQAVTTTPVTSTVNVPVGSTEGLAALIKVRNLDSGEQVHLTRLERIRSSETVSGYPVIPDVSPVIVITDNQEKVYSIPFTEGIEVCTFMVSSTTGAADISVLAAPQ